MAMKKEVIDVSSLAVFDLCAVTVDDKGNAYACTYFNKCVLKISVDGVVSECWKEKLSLQYPEEMLWCKNGDILVAQHRSAVLRISKEGDVSVFMQAHRGYQDGTLQRAQFKIIRAMVEDDRGNIFLTDSSNHTIRKVDVSSKMVSTIAGHPNREGHEDGTADTARFFLPVGIARDPKSGDLFVTDGKALHIRRLIRSTACEKEEWTVTSIKLPIGQPEGTLPIKFGQCAVGNGRLFTSNGRMLFSANLDGTHCTAIAATKKCRRSSLPSITVCNGFCLSGEIIFVIGKRSLTKLLLFQYWNQLDHQYFPLTTRQAVKTVMVASKAAANPNSFTKLPRELIPLILSFIHFCD
jgi:hypothetical protein